MTENDQSKTLATQHALFYFSDGQEGVQPGAFITKLFDLCKAADTTNLHKLWLSFPNEVTVFRYGKDLGVEFLHSLLLQSQLELSKQGTTENVILLENTRAGGI